MMNVLTTLRMLGATDAKQVRRDALLRWITLLPFVIALLLRAAVPPLKETVLEQFQLDLSAYDLLFMSFFALMTPLIMGMVVGFMLLDERDDGTWRALLVTPMSISLYLVYRMLLPMGIGWLLTVLCYPIAQLAPQPLSVVAVVALMAAPSGPIVALLMGAFAANKVAGFALIKMLNGVALLPMAAYFVAEPWQWVAGVLPFYWPLKLYWSLAVSESIGWIIAGGVVVNTAALLGSFYLFRRRNDQA